MCGAAGAWLPCAETRDSVGVGVGVGLGGSLGLIGFGGAAAATGSGGLAIATAAGSAGVGTVPAAEWALLLLLLEEVRRLVELLLRGLGAGGFEVDGIEVARAFCSGAYEGGAVEDDCCCCCCCCCCGCCCGW
jgi:hypothetical protein